MLLEMFCTARINQPKFVKLNFCQNKNFADAILLINLSTGAEFNEFELAR